MTAGNSPYSGEIAPLTAHCRPFEKRHTQSPACRRQTIDRLVKSSRRVDAKGATVGPHWIEFGLSISMAISVLKGDPTAGVKPPRREKTEGIHSWTDGEIEQYENRWPSGTYQRLAFTLLLYTGQRRSDVVRMGPADVRNGNLHIKQKKTKAELIIPIHPALQREIDLWRGEAQVYLLGTRGRPLSENGFYNVFKDWCREAGLPERCSPHGLRKAVARRLAEAGCSTHEIAAITGHKTLAEVGRYTRAASQPTMAKSGVDKLR